MSEPVSLPWAGMCQGAVSLSFDDGHATQLQIAMPILDELGLHGTFYVNPRGEDWRERLAPWREAAAKGHEIGNHTIAHTCGRNLQGMSHKALEDLTLAEIEADVVEAERRLREAMPEVEARSFAYPCYQAYVGEGATRQSYVPLIAQHFAAGRGMGEIPNHPAWADLYYLSSWPLAGWMKGEELIRLVESGIAQGRWVILTFHDFTDGPAGTRVPGAAYHHPPVPGESLRELGAHLAKEQERIWTGTVVAVAQRLHAWRQETKR